MNINQSGLHKPLQKPRLYNPAAVIRQQQVFGVVYSEQNKEKKLIEIIQDNQKILPNQFEQLVQDKNIDVICKLIEHRGHEFQDHHIEHLIARNDTDIDKALVAYCPKKLSYEKGEILIEKTREYFGFCNIMEFTPH